MEVDQRHALGFKVVAEGHPWRELTQIALMSDSWPVKV